MDFREIPVAGYEQMKTDHPQDKYNYLRDAQACRESSYSKF